MPPPSGSRNRPSSGTTERGNTWEQLQATALAAPGAVKNVMQAKIFLHAKGWIFEHEKPTLDNLARTLFAATAEEKVPTPTKNAISAVAYLLTEILEDSINHKIADKLTTHIQDTITTAVAQEMADSITELLKEPIAALTEDLKQKMNTHTRSLEEATQQAAIQVRTYSQIAATPPQPAPLPNTPALSYSQLQIQNREHIKRRQVLIDFARTEDMALEVMNEDTLTRKVKDSLITTWTTAPDPKPASINLKSSTLLRNGGLLLEMDTAEAATWLKNNDTSTRFLEGIGSGANIKNRSYQVIVQFVPVNFDPTNDAQIRTYEELNGIPVNSILKAEWIKPIEERKPNQKVATLRMSHRDVASANLILKQGAHIFNKRVEPKRPRKEPIRCLRCQRFGHKRRAYTSDNAYCGKCSGTHETDTCNVTREHAKCVNCLKNHPSYDRDCAKFWEKCRQMDQRCPENGLAFYPTDDPWTWVPLDQLDHSHSPPQTHLPPSAPHPHGPRAQIPLRQTHLTGSNRTPLGRNHTYGQESHDGPSQ